MLTAYLKEDVHLDVLQQAVNDVMGKCLPFLSGRLKKGFFWYSQKLLPPPQIVSDREPHHFYCYYAEGQQHVVRVLHGERNFSIENIHSSVDGRGLLKVIQTLLVRYFELLNVQFDNKGMINCADTYSPKESESGYQRFYNFQIVPNKHTRHKQISKKPNAYFIERDDSTSTHVIKHCFNLSSIKAAAKANSCSISEYMLTRIFLAFAAHRDRSGAKEPITSILPIDLRSFFPTESVRNFVGNKTIVMPETSELSEMIQGLRKQFSNIDASLAQSIVNEIQGMMNRAGLVPFALKKWVIRHSLRGKNHGITTTLRNRTALRPYRFCD